jgi:ureidoacrylate peracid hydrolase
MALDRKQLQEKLARGRAALVVVDMQNDFVSPKGKMAAFGFEIGCVRDSIPAIQRLLSQARGLGWMVIHTAMINELEQNPLSWYRFWGEPSMTIHGTWGAQHIEELRPLPGETVLPKYTYGAFIGTNLDTMLRRAGIETLVVAGTDVNICAGNTIHQGFALGYDIVAVADCLQCFSRKGREHAEQLRQAGLYVIENHVGLVAGSADLLETMGAGR